MALKSAFLGCGSRALGHADAYRLVKKGKLAAICDLDEQRLKAFGDRFGIDHRYTDANEMLEKEKPDLLHIVTLPSARVGVMTIAAEHEVPVAIVEKPISLQGEDYRQIKELGAKSKTKFVVNTQLHFHPRNLDLQRTVAEGRIGEVRFLDASARSTILDQGVHVLELAYTYNGCASPTMVFGQVSGRENLFGRQPSPDVAEATIAFENGVRALLLSGAIAPTATDIESIYYHKRSSVYGTRGFVQWTMGSWERLTPENGYESGTHVYAEEDVQAQAALTDAAFDWAEDESKVHPTRLDLNLEQFSIILAAYVSALKGTPVSLPFDPPDGLLDALKERLH